MPIPNTPSRTMAQQVAAAVRAFQRDSTGHLPDSVTVVLSNDTLVVTMHGALTPAERAMAATPQGAVQVQEFHRQLFATSSLMLRKEIGRITGVPVREAAAEVEVESGAVVHAFTSGTVIQVFLLADGLTPEAWEGATAPALTPPAPGTA